MSLQEVGQSLTDAGFTPDTHCVLGWGSTVDFTVFHRALLGRSMLLDPTPYDHLRTLSGSNGQNCLHPFNLSNAVLQCTNLLSSKLGFVHEVLFGKTNIQWHNPEDDCLEMAEILRWFINSTSDWVE